MLQDLMTQWMQRRPMYGMGQRQGMPMAGYEQPHPYQGQQGGYDSSGINPHGMYTGGQMPQQSTFPQNPGGFQSTHWLAGMFNRFRGS